MLVDLDSTTAKNASAGRDKSRTHASAANTAGKDDTHSHAVTNDASAAVGTGAGRSMIVS